MRISTSSTRWAFFLIAPPFNFYKRFRRTPKTTVRWCRMAHYLISFPDRSEVDWVVSGFRYGFSLGMQGTPSPWADPPNGRKVQRNQAATWDLIKSELDSNFKKIIYITDNINTECPKKRRSRRKV